MRRPPWIEGLPPNEDCDRCRDLGELCRECWRDRKEAQEEDAEEARREDA